jgi:hypothetical protein
VVQLFPFLELLRGPLLLRHGFAERDFLALQGLLIHQTAQGLGVLDGQQVQAVQGGGGQPLAVTAVEPQGGHRLACRVAGQVQGQGEGGAQAFGGPERGVVMGGAPGFGLPHDPVQEGVAQTPAQGGLAMAFGVAPGQQAGIQLRQAQGAVQDRRRHLPTFPRMDQGLGQIPLGQQQVFGLLAFTDLFQNPGHDQGASIRGVLGDLAPFGDPEPAAIGMADAVVDACRPRLRARLRQGQQAGPVVRVQAGQVVGKAAGDALGRQS